MLILHDTRPERIDQLAQQLDEIVRGGARRMLLQALDAEVDTYLEAHRDERDEHGHALVVRNGRSRPRRLSLRNGHIEVAVPRVNDRRVAADGRRRKFTSRLLPPYVRRPTRLVEILPILYLHELTRGDLWRALMAHGGEEAAALEPVLVSRIVAAWQGEQQRFERCGLADRDDLYYRVDGAGIRLDSNRLRLLLFIGIRPNGSCELVASAEGERESSTAWSGLLYRLRSRGMSPPQIVVGDPALGFWTAARDVWPPTSEPRCTDRQRDLLGRCLPEPLYRQLEALLGQPPPPASEPQLHHENVSHNFLLSQAKMGERCG